MKKISKNCVYVLFFTHSSRKVHCGCKWFFITFSFNVSRSVNSRITHAIFFVFFLPPLPFITTLTFFILSCAHTLLPLLLWLLLLLPLCASFFTCSFHFCCAFSINACMCMCTGKLKVKLYMKKEIIPTYFLSHSLFHSISMVLVFFFFFVLCFNSRFLLLILFSVQFLLISFLLFSCIIQFDCLNLYFWNIFIWYCLSMHFFCPTIEI